MTPMTSECETRGVLGEGMLGLVKSSVQRQGGNPEILIGGNSSMIFYSGMLH